MKKRIRTAFLLSFTMVVVSFGQLKSGSLGLTTSFFENPNLGLAYAASENTRITASVGFNFAHDSSGNSSTYHFGLSMWRYVLNTESISNFLGGAVGFDAQSNPVGTSSSVDLAALYGAEYWFSTRFALHGTLQIHFDTGKFIGLSVSRVFTSAETGLTWYF
jgi:hypothetical protein